MPQVDPALLARAKAQIESHPRFQLILRQSGGRGGAAALDPREFGVDYLPGDYKYSMGSRSIVDSRGVADWLLPLLGPTAPLAVSALPFAGGAGGGSAAAPAAFDAAPAISSPAGAANAAAVGGATPLGGVAPTVAAGASALDKIKDALLSPRGIASLASIVPALAMSRGGAGNTDATNNLQRIQEITEARMRRVDPLHQAVTQLAFGRLPVSSRQGINLGTVPLPE